ncbi:hypothetical protein PHYBOEH_002423 [Phytophthora boehmeriae]|uniref:Mesoderm development candidate 2 n=1 Tax=Phytophthora boehmeriae TaxID=109152 RepID=A0A8T1XBY8_9STRA|nr:hypothetical protein PHYBOEH_002423 [Phytophthora boehmeriae]
MRLHFVSLYALLLLGLVLQVYGRTNAIDYDALEKAWESGDAEEELRSEGDEHYRQLADKGEEEAKAFGPQMIFVTLKHNKPQQLEPLPDIASRWKAMLWNGGVEVNIYEVAESKLLIGLQKGIFAEDVIRFIKEQHEVKEYEWNGKAHLVSSSATDHYQKHHHRRKKSPLRRTAKHGKGSAIHNSGAKPHKGPQERSSHPQDTKASLLDSANLKSNGKRQSSDEL